MIILSNTETPAFHLPFYIYYDIFTILHHTHLQHLTTPHYALHTLHEPRAACHTVDCTWTFILRTVRESFMTTNYSHSRLRLPDVDIPAFLQAPRGGYRESGIRGGFNGS